MPEEARDVKFQMMVSQSELREIDEYRWRNRFSSRAEAIRQLVGLGLRVGAKQGEAA